MARRDRHLRHEQRQAERRHGPDTSRTVHTFPDGWTIRQPLTDRDERLEGDLMHNCLTDAPMNRVYGPHAIGYSLRDTGNFPHVTICHFPHGDPRLHIAAGTTYPFGRANTHPKPGYVAYIDAWHATLPYATETRYAYDLAAYA